MTTLQGVSHGEQCMTQTEHRLTRFMDLEADILSRAGDEKPPLARVVKMPTEREDVRLGEPGPRTRQLVARGSQGIGRHQSLVGLED